MEVKIEPVKKAELETLVAISRQTFFDTFSPQNTKEDMEVFLEETFRPEILLGEMRQPFHHFFFAKWQNEVAGYLKLSTSVIGDNSEKDVLEISRIYVSKEYLGKGIGKALIQFAISFAEKENKRAIWLGVWERNAHAIYFYTRFGFEKCGEHMFMVGSDAQTDWLMKKDLTG